MIQGSAPPDSPEVLALVREGMALVDPVVRQVRAQLGMGISQQDMVSYGHEGLLNAARTFDKTRNVPFDRWATVKMRGTILEAIRRQSELTRGFHARLRAIIAANQTEEGLIDEDASSPPSTPEAADERLGAYLTAMATSLALGSLTIREGDELLETIEDERGTVEEEAIREQLFAQVRAAIAERPPQERAILEKYYFEGKPLEQASGGLSRSWSCRLLAQATNGVARALRRANVEP